MFMGGSHLYVGHNQMMHRQSWAPGFIKHRLQSSLTDFMCGILRGFLVYENAKTAVLVQGAAKFSLAGKFAGTRFQ